MTPYSYVKNKVYTKLGPSNIQGIGVFALRDIKQGTDLFKKWTGPTGIYSLTKGEFFSLDEALQQHLNDLFSYQFGVPTEEGKFLFHLYHDCHWVYTTPYHFINSGLDKANVDKITYKALRDIRKGEELLSNYGRYDRFPKKQVI